MTPAETARVLAKASAYDLRTVGEADVLAWHEILGPHPYEDAMIAVARHYAHTTERLMPAHLLAEMRGLAKEHPRPDCPLHAGLPAHNCGCCRSERIAAVGAIEEAQR